MNNLPPHLYFQRGIEQGHSPEVVARAAAEWQRLETSGIRPVLSLAHLARLTGVSHPYLREIVERVRDPYFDITRRKRDGGIRALSSPEPILMEVQRWILHNALRSSGSHPSSYAYQSRRSIVQCASQHLGARWLVKMDLHDFFGTIDETRVFRIFHEIGYSRLVSFELTRLCTRSPQPPFIQRRNLAKYPTIPSYAVTYQGSLPQGAPTSGALANAASVWLDRKLAVVASAHDVVYTRYSDDLTFSARSPFDRHKAARLISHVHNVVRSENFILHHKKTRVVPPGARHIVLGLMLGSDRVLLVPEFKRRMDVHIRGVDRFGLGPHAKHRGFRSIVSFINHVDGGIAFASSVERAYADDARARWNSSLVKSGYPVQAPIA